MDYHRGTVSRDGGVELDAPGRWPAGTRVRITVEMSAPGPADDGVVATGGSCLNGADWDTFRRALEAQRRIEPDMWVDTEPERARDSRW